MADILDVVDGLIVVEDVRRKAAQDEVFIAMRRLGLSQDAIELVFNVVPPDGYIARRDSNLADRRKQLDDDATSTGGKYDPSAKAPTVAVTLADAMTLNVGYVNTTGEQVTLKVRVGTVDRPDRVVRAGASVASKYTTSVRGGFTGQRMVVSWYERGVVIFDKVL